MWIGVESITSTTMHPGAAAGERMEPVLQGRAEATGTVQKLPTKLSNQSIEQFINATTSHPSCR